MTRHLWYVAVLGAVVTARQSHGGGFGDGVDTAFLTAGIVSLATAVFTGLWLVKATPAQAPAPAAPSKPVLETSAGTTD